ncbi:MULTISPECIES: hypothetical protein [unclassified Fusibacter]|uniref:hypothetical protein n=1 Tax=unclassified Fusibacter TaxID=2624464 RepID=UPI0010102279|nr:MULTISPECIES: hypothetical protein [unclassified Fusibacter]MCK8060336.1 hypothetical protein [Fusibacter sp. A2]NPE20375.1 hypothetical protein [Fusibacter sp. A1]RXV63581.1 hypothetical protein DWB64_00985 [Fusibacter sp. A1]
MRKNFISFILGIILLIISSSFILDFIKTTNQDGFSQIQLTLTEDVEINQIRATLNEEVSTLSISQDKEVRGEISLLIRFDSLEKNVLDQLVRKLTDLYGDSIFINGTLTVGGFERTLFSYVLLGFAVAVFLLGIYFCVSVMRNKALD